jgi:hypothetical protein
LVDEAKKLRDMLDFVNDDCPPVGIPLENFPQSLRPGMEVDPTNPLMKLFLSDPRRKALLKRLGLMD